MSELFVVVREDMADSAHVVGPFEARSLAVEYAGKCRPSHFSRLLKPTSLPAIETAKIAFESMDPSERSRFWEWMFASK